MVCDVKSNNLITCIWTSVSVGHFIASDLQIYYIIRTLLWCRDLARDTKEMGSFFP